MCMCLVASLMHDTYKSEVVKAYFKMYTYFILK